MTRLDSESGFSFLEIMIALTIFAVASVPLLFVATGAQRLARSQSEASDLQQRLRVATDKLQRDLTSAGAGPIHGATDLAALVPVVVPARTGFRLPDPELSAFPDRLTVLYVPDGGWQTPLSAAMLNPTAALLPDTSSPGCGRAGLCGFTPGSRALVLDPRTAGAGYDLFTVTDIAAGLAHAVPNRPFSRPYAAGDFVMPIVQRVYYLDRANRRLMLYDGYQSDLPLVDNVLDLRFDYFVDASPASVVRPPEGEASCLFQVGLPPPPLLEDLGGVGVRPLPLERLRDGPVCGVGPNTFDGDLLRIRLVRVTLRLQAGADDVRGTGSMFSRPGHSTSAYSYVPDYEVSFDVAPRNLAPVTGRR